MSTKGLTVLDGIRARHGRGLLAHRAEQAANEFGRVPGADLFIKAAR